MRFSLFRFAFLSVLFVGLAFVASPASAQFGGFGGGMGGGGFGGMGGGGFGGGGFGGMGGGGFGGGMMAGMAGVHVDAKGELTRATSDPTGALTRKAFDAAKIKARDEARSPMRKVSLTRLEKTIERLKAERKDVTPDINCLAGLTRIEYVFLMPETNDIVIAGPAEPFFFDPHGEARGIDSGRPTLYLHDLVVALRAFPPSGRAAGVIGCSIDPTAEGLARMQEFVNAVARSGQPPNAAFIVNGIREAMGKQNVSVTGVSPNTHFAHVLVAADYRMKLIGIGEERPPVKIPSYVSLVKSGRSSNALVRWYFTPNYEAVRVSEDGMAMQLEGDGVKLVGADEVVLADGSRLDSKKGDAASQRFCQAFTNMYPELAAAEPVYAQLRNLIDLSIAAAFIQDQDFYGKADWHMTTFGDERAFPVEVFAAPQQVDTVVTAVVKGSRLMTPTGGGVNIQPRMALQRENLLEDENDYVQTKRSEIDLKNLPADRWWWD